MSDEVFCYRWIDDFDPHALEKKSKVRSRTLESRTIIVPASIGEAVAFDICGVVPASDRETVYNQLVARSLRPAEHPFFSARRTSGYYVLSDADVRTWADLSELLYLPYVGVFGRPTAIINASKRFTELFGSDGRYLAILHNVPYYDTTGPDVTIGVPHGRIDA